MDSEYDRVRAVSDGRFKYIRNYMPEKPNYQNIQYRLQNPLMGHLLELNEKGLLNENQARWFAQNKPKEELYDTQNDPWEFTNLVGNPEYDEKLSELRKAHENWMAKYGDKGALNEMEMVKAMWNGGENPPVTAEAEVSFSEGKVTLTCPTPSALIGWRKSSSDSWKIYTEPFEAVAGDSLYVNSHRIGFERLETAIVLD
jgi:hypothetical protein